MTSSMKLFNCQMLQVVVHFDVADFNFSEFKKHNELDESPDIGIFVSHYNNSDANNKEHGHIELDIDGENSSLKANFFNEWCSDEETNVSEEIELSKAVSVFSRYFKEDKVNAVITSYFRFDENLEPNIKLNYPLLLDSELLNNASVSGYEITFSNDLFNDGRILITSNKKNDTESNYLSAIFNSDREISIENFNYLAEVETIASHLQAFVKEKVN